LVERQLEETRAIVRAQCEQVEEFLRLLEKRTPH
jgi:hypothetical protein